MDFLEVVDDYPSSMHDMQLQDTVTRKFEELEAEAGKVIQELLDMEGTLKFLSQDQGGDCAAEMLAVSSSIVSSEVALARCKELQAYILEHEKLPEKRKKLLEYMSTVELKVKAQQIKLKSMIARSQPVSGRQSKTQSRGRT